MNVLVTGATGYIGGRLIPRLLERGHTVRVLVRDAARIQGRSWVEEVDVVSGDVLKPESLAPALRDIECAYYLVHSMYGAADFEVVDRRAAGNFAAAAKVCRHVIYLGGLLPEGAASQHLRSRAEVGCILREAVPATEFQAGPIIGSGSASFEMVRYLTERLPVMVAPKWVRNAVQPISIRDMLDYLLQALDHESLGVVQVGADRLSFRDMMQTYADVRGFRRWILPVPVLAPGLAARWVGLVTPIPNRLAVPLVRGVVHPVVADTSRAERLFPGIRPLAYRESVKLALERTAQGKVETRWSGALGMPATYDADDWEGTIREVRSVLTTASPESLFDSFASLGGEKGWLFWDAAWKLRGLIDRLAGGPGLRRGRRHPRELLPGEVVDFWRVESVDAPHHLQLRAEMKIPGRARLQWESLPEGDGARLVQTATFVPQGLPGLLYWYVLYPFHRVIFSGLVRAVARDAESTAEAT